MQERGSMGWTASARGGPLALETLSLGAIGEGEVELQVEACGLCRSDLHLLDGNWGIGSYPMIPGHEAVGIVTAVGGGVTSVKVGDRVGVGWQCGACGDCEACGDGLQHLCRRAALTCVGRPGGVADRVRAHAEFAVPIPEGMESAEAAPLLCAGVSVYAPLSRFVPQGGRVAMLGMGGLGHLAVQYASAVFGCEVHVFSRSPDKAEHALGFGATALHAPDPKPFRGQFDLVLSTVDVTLPWDRWIRALKPRGTLCLVGMPTEPLSLRAGGLLAGEKSVTGSSYASPRVVREALDAAASAGVRAMIERRPFAEAPAAFDELRAGTARYRLVLER